LGLLSVFKVLLFRLLADGAEPLAAAATAATAAAFSLDSSQVQSEVKELQTRHLEGPPLRFLLPWSLG